MTIRRSSSLPIRSDSIGNVNATLLICTYIGSNEHATIIGLYEAFEAASKKHFAKAGRDRVFAFAFEHLIRPIIIISGSRLSRKVLVTQDLKKTLVLRRIDICGLDHNGFNHLPPSTRSNLGSRRRQKIRIARNA
ncbi:hypothetical protein K432DRAFT_119483 [Lepidopterella palustris CBS 459.81]|uniref:Uncharacterized protein n=1 Tax=Lepidopterella palustris CBS 459.81 TaxID=1314670 RepID=A0A8E2JJA3_9PEZI|nr:hypothetical protein K432DRAFT_119483 [Lepidopterella palustris CBS 459.81]